MGVLAVDTIKASLIFLVFIINSYKIAFLFKYRNPYFTSCDAITFFSLALNIFVRPSRASEVTISDSNRQIFDLLVSTENPSIPIQ
jgi:hypothetical protein